MIIDISILLVAVATSLAFAFVASYLKNTIILSPVRNNDPVPFNLGAPIPFRLTAYGNITDKTAHRPRILLALVIFSIAVLIMKPIFNLSYNWNFIILSSSAIIMFTLFIVNLRKTILFMLFLGIFPFLLNIFEVKNIFWVFFSAGIIPGLMIGIDLYTSYHSLLLKTKEHKDRFSKIYTIILQCLPIVLVYQIASYFFPPIDIVYLIDGTSGIWQWILFPFIILVTLNIAWLALPIFRETLTTSSIDAAAEFTTEVRKLEEKAKLQQTTPRYLMALDRQARVPSMTNFIKHIQNSKDRPKNQDVNDYLNSKNSWLFFQSEQLAPLLFITIFLVLRFFCETLEVVYLGNISTFTNVFQENLSIFFNISSSLALWVNIMFLIVLILDMFNSKNGEKTDLEENLNILEKFKETKNLIVTCPEQENGRLLQIEEESILEQDADKSTEEINIQSEDITQKLWFKIGSFLAIFGAISLLIGIAGNYAIGGNISNSDKVKFGGSGEKAILTINGFASLGSRYAVSDVKITSPDITAIKSYEAEERKWKAVGAKPNVSESETSSEFSVVINCKISEDSKWIGKTIPVKISLIAHYPTTTASKHVKENSKEITKEIELKILSPNKWIMHEISRYLMVTGIITLIFFVFWIIIVYQVLRFKKNKA